MSESIKQRFRNALNDSDLDELESIYSDLFGADEASQEDPLFAKFKSFMLTVDETAPQVATPKSGKTSKVSKKKVKSKNLIVQDNDKDEPIPTKIKAPYIKGTRAANAVKHSPVFPCANLYDEEVAEAMAQKINKNKTVRKEYTPDIRTCENCPRKFDYNTEYPMGSTIFGAAGESTKQKILCQKCRDIK